MKSETRTNWDEYYASPFPASKFTRRISARKVIKLVRQSTTKEVETVAEIGGGNSYFVDYFLNNFKLRNYSVLDTNNQALEKLSHRFRQENSVTSRLADVCELDGDQSFDAVFSIGLVEHFDIDNTCKAIESHFKLCRPGGIVLISFPTPTLLYRLIRGTAELLGLWKFPDERPLGFEEVIDCATKFGRLEHRSILWAIGLTQGYTVFCKNGAP